MPSAAFEPAIQQASGRNLRLRTLGHWDRQILQYDPIMSIKGIS